MKAPKQVKGYLFALASGLALVAISRAAAATPTDQEELAEGRAVIGRGGELLVLQYAPATGLFILNAAGNPVASFDSTQAMIFGQIFPASERSPQLKIVPGDASGAQTSSFEMLTPQGLERVEIRDGKVFDVNRPVGPSSAEPKPAHP